MASFSAWINSTTAYTASWGALFTGGDSSHAKPRYVELLLDGVLETYVESAEYSGGTNNFTWQFSNLSPSTTYTWSATLYYINGSGDLTATSYTDSGNFTTDKEPLNVEPWSWQYSNGVASNTETRNFYNVLYGSLPADPRYFSHNVWNDLIDKVYELVVATEATSSGWDETYAEIWDTKVSAGDILTAVRFNSLRQNVNRVCSKAGISPVTVTYAMVGESGDNKPIFGKYFIIITDKINEIIESG